MQPAEHTIQRSMIQIRLGVKERGVQHNNLLVISRLIVDFVLQKDCGCVSTLPWVIIRKAAIASDTPLLSIDSYPVRNLTRSRAIHANTGQDGDRGAFIRRFVRFEGLLYLEGDRQGWTRDAKPNSFLQVSGSMIHSEEAFAANVTLLGKRLAVCPWSQGFLSRNPHL